MKIIVAIPVFCPDVGGTSASGISWAERYKDIYTFCVHFHLFESYIVHQFLKILISEEIRIFFAINQLISRFLKQTINLGQLEFNLRVIIPAFG